MKRKMLVVMLIVLLALLLSAFTVGGRAPNHPNVITYPLGHWEGGVTVRCPEGGHCVGPVIVEPTIMRARP